MKFLLYILTFACVFSCRKEAVVREELKQPEPCFINQDQIRQSTSTAHIRPDRNNPYPLPRGNYSAIYIDFDGELVNHQYWNNGQPFYCEPAGISPEQEKNVLERVREAFYPFKVYVTDSLEHYLSANRYKRVRVIVTPTSAWRPGVGGVALYDSFIWGDETPAFVFSDRLLFSDHHIGELVAHESGHTLNLAHQSIWSDDCILTELYNPGKIMGNSLMVDKGSWTYGTTQHGCTVYQQDSIMLKSKLGLRQ